MSAGMKPEVEAFLRAFFGEGNKISFEHLKTSSQEKIARFRPWVERLTNAAPKPTVLPCVREGSVVDWFGISFSEKELRELGEELMAFIGPTYSTFRRRRAELDRTDPVEAAVFDFTGGKAYKFRGDDSPEGAKKIWQALELMRQVWEKRPNVEPVIPRALGRVLRDFHMSLRTRNRASAEEHLRYLEDSGRLDAINLLFLRVQLLAELELWEELLNHPDIPDIIQVRRPLVVTQALIRAVYQRELLSYESEGDGEGATRHFRDSVFPRYSSLYAARSGLKDSDVLKSFMMLAAVSEPPRFDLREEILAASELPEPDQGYLDALASLLPPQEIHVREESIELAAQASKAGDFDSAFNLVISTPHSLARTELLFECAYELQLLKAEKLALEGFNNLSIEEKEFFLKTRKNRTRLEEFTGRKEQGPEAVSAQDAVPTSWAEWLRILIGKEDWSRALDTARQGVLEWEVTHLLKTPGAIDELLDLLQRVPRSAEDTLHNALPYLLEYFQKDANYPRRDFQRVYGTLQFILVTSTDGGEDDLELFNELVVVLLNLGVNETEYLELVEYGNELWGRLASSARINWVLDFLDLLIAFPCPNEEARLQFLINTVSSFSRFFRRVEPEQWSVLKLLCDELGQKSIFDEFGQHNAIDQELIGETEDLLAELTNKSIAVYTLTESVGRRMKNFLESSCRGVLVHLSHEKVGSERLRQLAQNADLFIMSTASAKHAATGFIEANRRNKPLLRPAGKGSASMIRELYSYLRT